MQEAMEIAVLLEDYVCVWNDLTLFINRLCGICKCVGLTTHQTKLAFSDDLGYCCISMER